MTKCLYHFNKNLGRMMGEGRRWEVGGGRRIVTVYFILDFSYAK